MAAVALAPGVFRIPTAPADLLNSYALVGDGGDVTLVDAGLRGGPRKILAALAGMGKAPGDVTRIVLTHAHVDHAGGLARLVGETGAAVASHERDSVEIAAFTHGAEIRTGARAAVRSFIGARIGSMT